MFRFSSVTRCFNSFFAVILFLAFVLPTASKASQKVTLPLTLDEVLLTSLLAEAAFTGPGRSADVVGQKGDCIYVQLEKPQYQVENDLLKLEIGLNINGGTELGGKCLFPMSWNGYLVLWQKPVFPGDEFALSFKIVDSALLNAKREPAAIAGFVWDLVKTEVYGHLERVRVDLAPPVSHLRSFLGPLFKDDVQETMGEMLDSMHRGSTYITAEDLIVELVAEVEEVYQPAEEVTPLTPEERAEIIELWERWDSFLVYLIGLMAHGPLEPEERQLLMDSLLESRYAFSAALEDPEMEGDLVRVQFLEAWENLSPLFRKQLTRETGGNSLGYLAFFTAGDALELFDSMGPTFGIELSQEGLLYLVEMLSGETTSLPYVLDLDNSLRNIFDLDPHEESAAPEQELKEIDLPEEAEEVEEIEEESLSYLLNFMAAPAYAAGKSKIPSFSEILKWKVPADPYPEYVTKVREVLERATTKIVDEDQIPASLQGIYGDMIPAFAWQESCFRQFVVKKKKFTYLLSYNGTSVGLMQINERIWRGLYDRERLRWDINYNAVAGCEILALYLNRYVLRDASWVKGENPRLLARLLYSMYNGGPGQYKKFLQREKSGKHYKSDKLFAEKLEWSMKQEWQNIRRCLVGG